MNLKNEPHWNSLVAEISPPLYRYFCALFPTAQASDLVQETLIRLIQKFRAGHYNPENGSLLAYSFGIAHFIKLENYKRNQKLELTDDDERLEQSAEVSYADPSAHLRWAVQQLKYPEQDIILFLIDDELSLEQISGLMNIPLGTIKSHIHRAKENLKKLMEVHP